VASHLVSSRVVLSSIELVREAYLRLIVQLLGTWQVWIFRSCGVSIGPAFEIDCVQFTYFHKCLIERKKIFNGKKSGSRKNITFSCILLAALSFFLSLFSPFLFSYFTSMDEFLEGNSRNKNMKLYLLSARVSSGSDNGVS
jgi:hypothetical protein